ncbi:hypothetical protein PLESTM_001481300 [Pleodorina starrii]|nr:hypothetical protein PLESTM_001481300 [Pleodorina starrii]
MTGTRAPPLFPSSTRPNVEAPSPLPRPPPPLRSPPPPVNLTSECAPSKLGYQCATVKGKVTVHWSVNTSSAPANPCTPSRRTVATAAALTKYGTLHMAVQAEIGGYVSIGFLGRSLQYMFPADIVLGYAKPPTRYIQTFYAKSEALSEADRSPPAGSAPWGYDMGVMQTSANGVPTTTICFSRRLSDNRTKASQSLNTSGGKLTPFIWAVSTVDGFKEHASSNRGGFYLDLGIAGAGGRGCGT